MDDESDTRILEEIEQKPKEKIIRKWGGTQGIDFQAYDDCQSSPSIVSCSTLSQPVFLDIKLSNDSRTSTNQEKFVCRLDCTMYNKDDIIVKVLGRGIIVEAPPEEQHGKGLYKKLSVRDSFDLEKAEALLSSDKALTIYVPCKNKMAVDDKRSSNIEKTGKSLNKEKKEIQEEN